MLCRLILIVVFVFSFECFLYLSRYFMLFYCFYVDWEINIYLGNFCGEYKCM